MDDYTLIRTYNRPNSCFTQGFIYESDTHHITESCGRYRFSKIQTYELNPLFHSISDPKEEYKNDDKVFAEGLARLNDKYYQLTWRENLMYEFDKDFNLLNQYELPSEMRRSGWGLTTDGHYLLANSGTNVIFKIDPNDMKVIEQIEVILYILTMLIDF